MTARDAEYDFVAVGSGAGGMAAALTAHDAGLSAVVVAKAGHFGGSSAISGGVRVPGNPTLTAAGQRHEPGAVRGYLDRLAGDRVPAARLDAYVEHGPEAMRLLGNEYAGPGATNRTVHRVRPHRGAHAARVAGSGARR